MKAVLLLPFIAVVARAQLATGELRVFITDPTSLPLPCSGTLSSDAPPTQRKFDTNDAGRATLQHLPSGIYRLNIQHAGFTPSSTLVEIRSGVPVEIHIELSVQRASTNIDVTDAQTLLDPHQGGVIYSVGTQQIREQQSSVPGRAVLELVDMQPGWLFEANATLHPRGSEYQTLFVIDGVPMDENRSPAFAPGLEAGEVQSMSILTANYPAEYGRKLGGVVEVTTSQDIQQGFHGSAELGAGSFGTATGFLSGAYGWDRSTLSFSASGEHTNRYLDPPVLANYTNSATLDGMTAAYDRDLSDSDRIHLYIRRTQSSFEVPNESVQQAAGQRQDRNSREDLGQAAWTHDISADLVFNLRAAVEDLSANLWSNPSSSPIIAFQQRGFRRGYLASNLAAHKGRHEIKIGGDAYYAPVTEALQYEITKPSYFDPGTPHTFDFFDHAIDREQSLFAQDTMHFGNLTLSTGIRWDHYGVLVRENAWSPRLGAAWYWPKGDIVFHISYDRAFLTPALENLLLASSPQVDSLDPLVLRVPIRPSTGNFYEAGFTKGIAGKLRLDATVYRRTFRNFADDDVFLNTGISFPIAFHNAQIHGVDVKLDLPRWGAFSGFLSYSNMAGIAQLPVTGGLFLGDSAQGVLGVRNTFPISQDQRNTARARVRYQLNPRVWMAATAGYGSGLPTDIDPSDIDIPSLVAQYGQRIVDKVNFSAGRVRPNFSLNASVGAELWKREKQNLRVQLEGENLTDRLNLINFEGLFSGTAVAPPRSGSLRLQYSF
ncbi:MAG: TonB-dependent receptor [Bryobacteraceae bacterium]